MDEQKEQKKLYNTGLISLEVVAKFNQIDIDMRSIVRNYGIESADVSPEEIISQYCIISFALFVHP